MNRQDLQAFRDAIKRRMDAYATTIMSNEAFAALNPDEQRAYKGEMQARKAAFADQWNAADRLINARQLAFRAPTRRVEHGGDWASNYTEFVGEYTVIRTDEDLVALDAANDTLFARHDVMPDAAVMSLPFDQFAHYFAHPSDARKADIRITTVEMYCYARQLAA